MKRTSKKLLSFLLAVVMIVTSCSVGFTALAADVNPQSSSNSTSEAEEAYESIEEFVNRLVPIVLGIEIGDQTIGEMIGISREESKTISINEVVAKASPLLLNLLGDTKVDAKTFLMNHSDITGIKTEDQWSNKYYNYYSYLNGSSDDLMSFYSLYAFCEQNIDSDNAGLAAFCQDLVGGTDGKLKVLLQICSMADKSYTTEKNNVDKAYTTLVNKATTAITSGKSVDEIGQVQATYNKETKAIDDFPLVDDEGTKTVFGLGIDQCNKALEAIGSTKRATKTSEAIVYYYANFVGKIYNSNSNNAASKSISYVQALSYIKLADEGGTPIKTASGTALTLSNFESALGVSDPFQVAKAVYALLFDKAGSVDYLTRTWDAFCSSSYEAINIANLYELGGYGDTVADVKTWVNDQKITAEDLGILYAIAQEEQWGEDETKLKDYLTSDSCLLNKYAANALYQIYAQDKTSFTNFYLQLYEGVDKAMAFSTSGTKFSEQAQARNAGKDVSIIDYLNDIMSGIITRLDLGTGTKIPSANIVSKPSADYLEILKYKTVIKPKTDKVSYSYAKYAIPEEYVVITVNDLLNKTVGGLFTGSTGEIVNPVIDGLLETKVVLYTEDGKGVLNNVWSKLCNNTIETITDLIPVLTVVVDELLIPILFSAQGDPYNGVLDGLTTAEIGGSKIGFMYGNTKIGLLSASFDLNKIIPGLLTLLSTKGGYDAAKEIVTTTYDVKGESVSVATYDDYIKYYDMTHDDPIVIDDKDNYKGDTLIITGVYVADKALCGLDLEAKVRELLDGQDKDMVEGVVGFINNTIDTVNADIKKWLSNPENGKRYVKASTDIDAKVSQTGLNNLAISFPYLMDIIGNDLLKALNIDSDWSTIYDGKFITVEKTFKDGKVKQVNNASIEKLKGYAVEPDPIGILDTILNATPMVKQLTTLVSKIGSIITSPTEAYWTFSKYATSISNAFDYPKNITATEANKAVDSLDNIVNQIFPLLKKLGVADIESLESLVNDKLYTNEILTTIAKTIYGAVDGALVDNKDVYDILKKIGIDFSPAGFARYLEDSKYGATYSSAASTLKSASSWDNVSSLYFFDENPTNFDGTLDSYSLQQGFINGIAALLRPVNAILTIILADSAAYPEIKDLGNALRNVTFSAIDLGDDKNIHLSMTSGVLTVLVDGKDGADPTKVSVDVANILQTSNKGIISTNAYESAVIPLLEAFMCDDIIDELNEQELLSDSEKAKASIKTYDEYKADYNKAADNLIIDILNPIIHGFVYSTTKAPVNTLTDVLPNVAYFIDSNGLAQVVKNLLAPITSSDGLVGALNDAGLDFDSIITTLLGKPLGKVVTDAIGIDADLTLSINDLNSCNIQVIVLPLVRKILKDNNINIQIPDISLSTLASLGTLETVSGKARNDEGKFERKRITAEKGQVLITVLRYVADVLITNASEINSMLQGIDAIKNNDTIKNILDCVFTSINAATKDDIVRAIFYFIAQTGSLNVAQDSFFDYSGFTTKTSDFSFGNMDEDFCRQLAPMLDGLVNGLLGDKGGLVGLIGGIVYKDDIISSIATGLYGAIEGVNLNIGSFSSLTDLLAATGIDFTTGTMADLLTDSRYGKTYAAAASTIKNAGSWKNVNKSSLSWGVTDRESFLNALCAVLRPLYSVLDVILNDSNLNLLNLVAAQGSDGYTSTIVPLLEAFGCYNIKTQYDYRMDMSKTYDSILLDILNPIMDKVEDILNAPIEMVADILPNLSLFFANDGLLQIIDNLLTPISALLDAIRPVLDVNSLLAVLDVNLNSLLSKIGVTTNVTVNVYDLKSTLKPLISSSNVVSLLNGILGTIKISGNKLGIVLPDIDWYALASHGTVIKTTSQAAATGERLYVQADQDETLIAVLRFLINTINYKDNYNAIVSLVSGLLGGAGDSVAGVVDQVLGMLQGDADTVIENLVDLLQSIAG